MSLYAFIDTAEFDPAVFHLGHRASLDGQQVVAKLAPGQAPAPGAVTRSHEETLAILSGPEWSQEEQ